MSLCQRQDLHLLAITRGYDEDFDSFRDKTTAHCALKPGLLLNGNEMNEFLVSRETVVTMK